MLAFLSMFTESAIANYELAARMQLAVPELMDLRHESKQTQEAYGLFDEFKNTTTFGRQCLIARRLVERGVRFIQLTCPGGNGDRWDQHGNLKDGHSKNARSVDQPIAALLADLAERGLPRRRSSQSRIIHFCELLVLFERVSHSAFAIVLKLDLEYTWRLACLCCDDDELTSKMTAVSQHWLWQLPAMSTVRPEELVQTRCH